MYVLAFVAAYILIPRQRRSKEIGLRDSSLDALMIWLLVGLVAGARLGYVLFYRYGDLGEFFLRPIEIVAVWRGGMSFHGGLIGCLAAGWFFCRKRKLPFPAVADSVVVTAPIGLGLGRIGNFINGELFGRVTDVPWAMVFPDGGPLPRHPSQLYQAFTEGAALFVILWFLRRRRFPDGMMIALFLFFYGVFRFFTEFFREPDAHLGFIAGPLTMGQLLSSVMILLGTAGVIFLLKRTGQVGLDLSHDSSKKPARKKRPDA